MAVTLPAEGATATTDELRRLTELLVASVRSLLRGCRDADVIFLPDDPLASDPGAEDDHEANAGWTAGHILVHTTASAEESAALAAELARGVEYHGRSRREVSWQEIATVAQCRARLDESLRIRLASLEMWPDAPDLSNTYIPWEGATPMNAVARYLLGLRHEAAHVEQLRDAIAQARADRRSKTFLGRLRGRSRRTREKTATSTQSAG